MVPPGNRRNHSQTTTPSKNGCVDPHKLTHMANADMIKYNKIYHSIKDVNEENYNTLDMKYDKNIYVLNNGRMLRDYFENGRWELADKSISDVYIWIKS